MPMNNPIDIISQAADVVRADSLPYVYKTKVLLVLRSARLYISDNQQYHKFRSQNGSTVNKLQFAKKSV
jgi:hypothetical protein